MPIDPIKEHNRQFIEKLTGKESVGVDSQGRLYQEIGIIGFTKKIFKKADKRIGNAVFSYALDEIQKSTFHHIDEGPKVYKQLLLRLDKTNLLSVEDKEAIALAWYAQRCADLVDNNTAKEVAEAIITIEMCQDPSISAQLKSSIRPEPTSGGTSGSYFIKNRQGIKIGIFKPQDEEVYMPHNPKGYRLAYNPKSRHGPKLGHLQGSSWQKERAAWEIDNGEMAGVPFTTTISVPFPKAPGNPKIITKKGSFQVFAQGQPVEELVAQEINNIPTKEVQKIACFDLIIGNADRNLGNVLYDTKEQKLTPIDHGLILLDSLTTGSSEMNCHWLTWPQVKQPVDPALKAWILNYNIDEKCEKLKEIGITEESIREHRFRVIFLKEAINKGLNLFEIGMLSMQTAETADSNIWLSKTVLETMYSLSEENYADDAIFSESFKQNIQKKLQEI